MADVFRRMPNPAYKISKAALNMLTIQYAKQYQDEGFTFLGISPGVRRVIFDQYYNLANVDSGSAPTLEGLEQISPSKQVLKRCWILFKTQHRSKMEHS
jgi:NAD(P)-dependent dehydrogenase (short-subunit alcohol dehydrogenase family)